MGKKILKTIFKFPRSRWLLIILGILIFSAIIFFVFLNPKKTSIQNLNGFGQRPGGAENFGGPPDRSIKPRWNGSIPKAPKEKITYYKGLWAGNWFYPEEYSGLKPEPEKYKQWGVNIVNIQPGFEINKDGEVRYPVDYPTYEDLDAWFGQLAEMFYKNNIHLAMTVMIHYKEEFIKGVPWGGETAYIPKEKAQNPGYFKYYDMIVTDMAKIAQKYDFYLFSPMGEPENVFLDAKIASDWNQQILPKIEKYYRGKIYYKGDLHKGEGDQMNFKGYDVLGMVTTPVSPNATIEEAKKTYASDMERVLAWAKRDNIPEIVISEYGYLGKNKMESATRIGVILEEGNKNLSGVFLTEPSPSVLKTTQGNQIVEQIIKWFLSR